MVLAARLSQLKWGFVAVVATAPLTRWLAIEMESRPSSCPSQMAFGVACPACGGTRAGLYLASGDVATAIERNAGFVVFCAAMAVMLIQQHRADEKGLVASIDAEVT
jgi:hypothetical protein